MGSVSSPYAYEDGPDLAVLAALLADRTRAAFCLALLDGRAWTAAELARHAGVAPSTATGHLHRLVTGGLLTEERRGRHRYVRLAGADTAEMIESLASHAPYTPTPVRSLTDAHRRRALARARTCYDHLAGALGVAVTDAMTRRGYLDWHHGPALTAEGLRWLRETGVADDRPAGSRRPHVRTCLDWTERRDHLAGALGAALFRHGLDAGWLTVQAGSRIVRVTEAGAEALHTLLDLPDTLDTAVTTA